jgi:hypothetical protein
MDNWGWCNGVDSSGNPTGYFNGPNARGAIQSQCNESYLNPITGDPFDHWTRFQGQIIVIPQSQ